MIERHISGWKQECRVIADQLIAILTKPKLEKTLDEHFTVPTTTTSTTAAENINESTKQSSSTTSTSIPVLVPISSQQISNNNDNNLLSDSITIGDESINRKNLTSAPISVNGDISVDMDDNDNNNSNNNDNKTQQITNRSYFSDEGSESSSRIVNNTFEYIPSVIELCPYDTLISKLHQEQTVYISNEIDCKKSETIKLLGAKSYSDEGRIQTIRQKVKADELKYGLKSFDDYENKLNNMKTNEYFFQEDHVVSRQERKQMLIKYIRDKKELNNML